MRTSIRLAAVLTLAGMAWLSAFSVEAGDRLFRKRSRVVVETATTIRPEDRVAPSPMLGTFQPTPYITVGKGYSTLGYYGRENSLAVYGPLSAFRATSAPVSTVVRGYDGAPVLLEGTSFSNPNQPALSPVVYPTRASNYSALRFQTTAPQRDKAFMWIDQN
jgi:hypothetical protein